MKVGFLYSHPFSESLGSLGRVSGLAIAFKERGVEPVILTPFENPSTLNGVKTESIPNLFLRLGVGSSVYNLAKGMARQKLFHSLIVKNTKRGMGDGLLKVLEKTKVDILQIEQEPTAIAVLPLLERIKIPVLLDFHGIWAEELVDSNILKRESKYYRSLQGMVREAVLAMDGTIVMSTEMKDYVTKEYAFEPSKIHVAELGANPFVKNVPEKTGPQKVVYAGLFSKDKNADLFLNSIFYVADRKKDVEFHITAKGNLWKKAQAIKKKKHSKIFGFWFSKQTRLLEFMSTCNLGVLTLPNNLSYKINPATKFFDYLSVGLPIVANNIGGWTRIIKERNLGFLTNDNPKDFAEGIVSLAEDPEFAKKCGQRGLELLNNEFNIGAIAEKLLNVYKKL